MTRILGRIGGGAATHEDHDRIWHLVYDELRHRATGITRHERSCVEITPTIVVHETYLKLIRQKSPLDAVSTAHFKAIVARVMQQRLVELVRERDADKRGGRHQRFAVATTQLTAEAPSIDLIALDVALARLAELKPRAADAIRLRFFGGLTIAETALVAGVSETTIQSDWRCARAWLSRELSGDPAA